MGVDNLSLEQIAALPVDRLGMEILSDVAAGRVWHWGNSVLEFTQQRGLTSGSREVGFFVEAWEWLFQQGLVRWDPQQTAERAVSITRLGREVVTHGVHYARTVASLDRDLVPALEPIRTQFLLGEFELGAFAAMREVEIAVRDLGGFPHSMLGVQLMRKAFGNGGPLRDQSMDAGEAQAQADLFAGAIGLFKNPSSHRRVDYNDPAQALEVVLLADLLLRLLKSLVPDIRE